MMNDSLTLGSAFLIGLLGSVHCFGMCGGIMNALSFAMPTRQRSLWQQGSTLLLYNLGRIFSYSVAGGIIGTIGWWLQGSNTIAMLVLRVIAGLMLIAMGLYLAGWWRGLLRLEQAGGHLWKHLQPLGKRLMPVTRPWQALLLGSLWGWLPCGLVYSTLVLAATSGNWQQSALTMSSFGLGTLPALLLTGAFARQLKVLVQLGAVRNVAALLVIGFGIWTLAWPWTHLAHQHNESLECLIDDPQFH